MRPNRSRRRTGALVLVAGGLLAAAIAAFHDVRADDAYITFRYAQNLARGLGMVFNPGQRVMGSTSPGEVLISALAFRLAGHDAMPGVMDVVGCLGWTAQAVCLYSILRRLGYLRAELVAAGIAVGAAGSAQWLPLETNLAAAATLAAIAFSLRSRWIASAAACALAGLLRPDAYIVCLPLAVLCVKELRGSAYKPALTLAALATPWPIFATVYFGSPIPQSAVVKYHHTSAAAYALHELAAVPSQHLAVMPTPAKVAFWLAAIVGGSVLVRADRRLWVLVAYGILHAAAYVVLAPDPAFTWHLYPLTLTAFVLVLVFASTLIAKLRDPARSAAAAAIVVACGVGTVQFARSHRSDVWYGARDGIYKRIAAYLASHAAPTDIVDAEEVGTLAYYADLRMNDRARLVTPFPGDVFWRLTHHRMTKLRWLVLNGVQVELEVERPYYEGRKTTLFTGGGWGLFLVDVRSPRTDGRKSEWD